MRDPIVGAQRGTLLGTAWHLAEAGRSGVEFAGAPRGRGSRGDGSQGVQRGLGFRAVCGFSECLVNGGANEELTWGLPCS